MVMYLVGTLLSRLPSVGCCERAHRVLTSGNVCTSATPMVFISLSDVDFFRKVPFEYGVLKLALFLNRWDTVGTFGHSCHLFGQY